MRLISYCVKRKLQEPYWCSRLVVSLDSRCKRGKHAKSPACQCLPPRPNLGLCPSLSNQAGVFLLICHPFIEKLNFTALITARYRSIPFTWNSGIAIDLDHEHKVMPAKQLLEISHIHTSFVCIFSSSCSGISKATAIFSKLVSPALTSIRSTCPM